MRSFYLAPALPIVMSICCSQLRSAEVVAPTLDSRRIVTVTAGPGSIPARIDWTTDLTLMAAITASGLFAKESLPEFIIIRHALRKGGQVIAHPKAILKGTEADPKLLPNDTIELPQSQYRNAEQAVVGNGGQRP